MMQTMRNSAKIVFFIVLVAFAGFMILQGLTSIFSDPTTGQQQAPQGVIGEIDGRRIPFEYFENAYRPRFRELLQENEEPSDEELQRIRDEIWNNLITITLLELEADRVGITVTNAEVGEYMKLSPPGDLQGLPDFQTDGRFDLGKYQVWLRQAAASNDPQIISFLANFENQIRQQLTITRLQEIVLSMIRITPEEVRRNYIESNEKVNVRYVYIPNSDFQDQVTEAPLSELKAKFERDKVKYENPAMASVSYVSVDKLPSDADYAEKKGFVDSLYNELLAGANYEEMSKEVSDDVGAGKLGGDLGWFAKGVMVDEFWQAISNIEKMNEVIPPVKTRFGWHLIKLTGRRETAPDSVTGEMKPEYKASHILIQIHPSAQTLADLETRLNEFIAAARDKGFNEAADEFDLEVIRTKEFSEGGFIPELGQNREVSDFAFESKPGDVSPVITVRSSSIVCGLPSITPAAIPPFDEVQDRVKESYLLGKRIDAAYERAKELALAFSSGRTLDDIAAETGKQILETGFFPRHQFVSRVGSDPAFIGAAFNLSAINKYSKSVKARSGAYLIEFIDKQEADTAFYNSKADSLLQSEISTKRRNTWPQFVSSLKNNADIVDYRPFYYGG